MAQSGHASSRFTPERGDSPANTPVKVSGEVSRRAGGAALIRVKLDKSADEKVATLCREQEPIRVGAPAAITM
jgi:hypothetical protein